MNKWDADEFFPVETMKKMGELGLLGIYIPEEYGGSGFGYFEYATALIELGKVCGGVGLSVAAHNSLCSGHIYYHGSEEQKKKLSIAMKGKQNRLGATLSDETKNKISNAHKGKISPLKGIS